MPRLFVRQGQINDNKVEIVGDDAHHIARSLRMVAGQEITVCDMQGNEYTCKISEFIDDKKVIADVLCCISSDKEPRCRIRLFQALPKGEKLDLVIQKAVECGVYEICPFESERCVVKVKADSEERKTERRNKIAQEAAKQCGRSTIPRVLPTQSFEQMLRDAAKSSVALFCYEGDGTEPLGRILERTLICDENGAYPDVCVVVGSEGGFSLNEAKVAKDAGMIMCGLGKRILRTETAPIFVLSCISLVTELS